MDLRHNAHKHAHQVHVRVYHNMQRVTQNNGIKLFTEVQKLSK